MVLKIQKHRCRNSPTLQVWWYIKTLLSGYQIFHFRLSWKGKILSCPSCTIFICERYAEHLMECCSAAQVKQDCYTYTGYWKMANVKKIQQCKISGVLCFLWEIESKLIVFPLHEMDSSINLHWAAWKYSDVNTSLYIVNDVNTSLNFPFLFLPVKICTWSVFFCFLKTEKMFFLVFKWIFVCQL